MAHQWRRGNQKGQINRKSLKQVERQSEINKRLTDLMEETRRKREGDQYESEVRY
jgi:predicted DNA-binding WGR domain protein